MPPSIGLLFERFEGTKENFCVCQFLCVLQSANWLPSFINCFADKTVIFRIYDYS